MTITCSARRQPHRSAYRIAQQSTAVADDNSDLDPADATPVTVLTGFLGAGKTTSVNRLLAEDHGRRLAVLVNDFGAANVDSELIVGINSGTVSLANGCVCCEIRDDLIQQITTLPRAVYRIKGFVHGDGDHDRRYLLQAVGMRSDIVAHDSWGNGHPETCLVLIADSETTDHDDVIARLDACRVTSDVETAT